MAQDPKVGREILPIPDQPYRGPVRFDARTASAPAQPMLRAPDGAPHVVIVLVDDMGFGIPSAFGGCVDMPTTDRLAQGGLRYNQMHTTALCSPTRAALITGRNHHSTGFGVISEQSTGFPGYNSIIPKDKATIGRILKDNGFATSWFGKNHNTPTYTASQVGPFDQWPIGMGFEYFYGFVGGDANQWEPNLFRNTAQIYWQALAVPEPANWALMIAGFGLAGVAMRRRVRSQKVSFA